MPLNENEWYIEAPWGRICIIAWGDCLNPPVLLCHGSLDSAATFRPLVAMLPENFYYIAMEFPGNGKSDWFPPGLMLSSYDLVYPVAVVVEHFRWQKFVYMAHSFGTIIGKLYNLSYPGKISKVINLDPTPNLLTVPADEFSEWYHFYFSKFYEKYETLNTPKETGPIYTYQEAIDTLKKKRDLTDELAAATLERISEPVCKHMIRERSPKILEKYIAAIYLGAGLVTRPPFSPDSLQSLFTSIPTPTLSIIAEQSIDNGRYDRALFKLDEKAFPLKNYRVRRVEGGHDVHLLNPERLAGFVSQFLLHGLEGLDSKAKL
ncbi:serine hydrolase-like protein [Ostrinia furnacalis]|uniref:serine hydrolase-like protein n=1 Tax=Ostrinia furnacalis TaxID=93504 RepID=UPI00103D9A7F|nr:serine hydrolase-like protein [Ostrinia furnacalis]